MIDNPALVLILGIGIGVLLVLQIGILVYIYYDLSKKYRELFKEITSLFHGYGKVKS